MKIKGLARIAKRVVPVMVGMSDDGQPVMLEVRAPRMTDIDQLKRDLPEPQAPLGKGTERNKDGTVKRDSNGQPIAKRHWDDPGYLQAMEDQTFCYSLALALSCIGDQVEPGSVRADYPTALAYYMAVWQELEDWGIDLGIFKEISRAAGSLAKAGPTVEEYNQAREAMGVSESSPGN